MRLTEEVGRRLGFVRACAFVALGGGSGAVLAGEPLGLVAALGGLLLWWGSS